MGPSNQIWEVGRDPELKNGKTKLVKKFVRRLLSTSLQRDVSEKQLKLFRMSPLQAVECQGVGPPQTGMCAISSRGQDTKRGLEEDCFWAK